jgi:uncharacterized protein YjbI with pentapeptide repeats
MIEKTKKSIDMRCATLKLVTLKHAKINNVNLSNSYIIESDLRYIHLQNSILEFVDFRWSDLRYSDLRNANLSYADLFSTDMRASNLNNANLSHSRLQFTDLRHSNLNNANFFGAAMKNCNFEGTIWDIDYDEVNDKCW